MTGTVIGSVAVAAPALAKGQGAKQNWFGVVGSDMNLGGGMSNYFSESPAYSPYSPYSPGDNSLFNKNGDQSYMTKINIDVLKDSQKRLQTVPGFIQTKKWEEIRSLLTAKVCVAMFRVTFFIVCIA